MIPRSLPALLLALLLSLSLLAAGCGGTGEDSTTTTTKAKASASGAADTTAPLKAAELEAKKILKKMTLRQKAAQVLMLDFPGVENGSSALRELLVESPPGGLMVMDYNVQTRKQLTDLISFFQGKAAESDVPVQLLISADQEGGGIQRIKGIVPDIPSPRKLGDNRSAAEAARIASDAAEELLSLGVNMNLAPAADVVGSRDAFMYSRTYSGDPDKVAEYATAVARAYERKGLISVFKHFPGHGSASGDSHEKAVVSSKSKADFEAIHLVPFRAGIKAGVDVVLISHVIVKAYDPKYPATSSKKIIEELLRDELGFKGLVISDAIEMASAHAVNGEARAFSPGVAAQTAVASLKAGCDMLISTGTTATQLLILDEIVKAVENGDLPQARLDEAVTRVLELKLSRGLTF